MATILITGGTGMIGMALTRSLISKGYSVIILTRDKSGKHPKENLSYAEWDIDKAIIDEHAIASADYIIHLAGAGVADKRWTAKRKKEIVDSRVKSGQLLVKAMSEIPNKVSAVISASAIGWYGPDGNKGRPFVETDPASDAFLGMVCRQWEAAIQPVTELGKRLVIFRTGIALSNTGGAFPEFKKPLKFRVATILGNGKQIVSWIHIDDLVRLYESALENPKWKGVYNAVSPGPVSNKELMHTIGPYASSAFMYLHVPSFALKLMLGEMSIEVLKSATVSSRKTENTGFGFYYPDIDSAISNLVNRREDQPE
jgi:uncharacterized protein (TIGR01777 family)